MFFPIAFVDFLCVLFPVFGSNSPSSLHVPTFRSYVKLLSAPPPFGVPPCYFLFLPKSFFKRVLPRNPFRGPLFPRLRVKEQWREFFSTGLAHSMLSKVALHLCGPRLRLGRAFPSLSPLILLSLLRIFFFPLRASCGQPSFSLALFLPSLGFFEFFLEYPLKFTSSLLFRTSLFDTFFFSFCAVPSRSRIVCSAASSQHSLIFCQHGNLFFFPTPIFLYRDLSHCSTTFFAFFSLFPAIFFPSLLLAFARIVVYLLLPPAFVLMIRAAL